MAQSPETLDQLEALDVDSLLASNESFLREAEEDLERLRQELGDLRSKRHALLRRTGIAIGEDTIAQAAT